MSGSPASDTFAFFEVVRFHDPDPEFAEVDGLTGYVAGKGKMPDADIAVFFYDIETVWCVPAARCTSLGRIDEAQRTHFAWAGEQIEKQRRDHDAQE